MNARLGFTGHIARASARRPWLTIGIWLAVLAAAIASAGTIGNYITNVQANLVTTEADVAAGFDADRRLADDGSEQFDESVIITSSVHQYGDADFNAAINDAISALAGVEGVRDITPPIPGATVSEAGGSAMVQFRTQADTTVVAAAVDAIAALSHPDIETFVFGQESTLLAFTDLAAEELARGEIFGLIAALVILTFVFGALVAAGLPLMIAIVSIITATGIAAVVARVADSAGVPMSDSVSIFIVMLGLALGIDYSLLSVQRFREELAGGATVMDAITTTGATANRAVLFSGGTIVVALGGLLVVPLNSFLGIGVGVMAVAFATVASALFLLPALLRLLGNRVNKGRMPFAHPGHESKRWRSLAETVARRPGAAAGIGLAVIATLFIPLFSIQFSTPGPDDMPEDFVAHRAYDVLAEDFGWTESATYVAISDADASPHSVDALADAIANDGAFAGTTVSWHGSTAYIDTNDVFNGGQSEAQDAIERLRTSLIPAALEDAQAQAWVGGARAYVMDETALLTSRAPWAVAIILGATFLLLLVMFRSIVLPLKAIILNLLGTGATLGALVAVYQWGWGSALGFPDLAGISPFMPVMVFALVFGLSMDYHVFLLSRVKERYDATGDTRTAVIEGITRTGPLITGAALIMIAVFSGFAIASIPELSQWGFGLAFGVAIDAAIIRVFLVPASMVWLDKANWYLPKWLQWLPVLTHEPVTTPQTPEALEPRAEEEREPALV